MFDLLENFHYFEITHGFGKQQIILLQFTHVKGTAEEWYAAEMGKTQPTDWDQIVAKSWSCFRGGPSQLRAATILKTHKMSKGQWVMDYFVKVMCLCKDLDPNTQSPETDLAH